MHYIYECLHESRNMRMFVEAEHKGVEVTHVTFLGSPRPLSRLEWEVDCQRQCGEMELKLIVSVCSLVKASGPPAEAPEQRVINDQCYILPVGLPVSYLIIQSVSGSVFTYHCRGSKYLADKIGNAFAICHQLNRGGLWTFHGKPVWVQLSCQVLSASWSQQRSTLNNFGQDDLFLLMSLKESRHLIIYKGEKRAVRETQVKQHQPANHQRKTKYQDRKFQAQW